MADAAWAELHTAQTTLLDLEELVNRSRQLHAETRHQLMQSRRLNRQDWNRLALVQQAEQMRQTNLAIERLRADPALIGMFPDEQPD